MILIILYYIYMYSLYLYMLDVLGLLKFEDNYEYEKVFYKKQN